MKSSSTNPIERSGVFLAVFHNTNQHLRKHITRLSIVIHSRPKQGILGSHLATWQPPKSRTGKHPMNHSLETRNWMIPADEFLDHPVDEQWFPVVPLNHPTESSTRKASQNIPCFIPSNHGTAVLMKICFNSKEVLAVSRRIPKLGSTVWRTSEKNVRSFFMGQKHHGNHAGRGKFFLINHTKTTKLQKLALCTWQCK